MIGRSVATMPGAVGLAFTGGRGWDITPVFASDSLGWNELETTDFIDDTVSVSPNETVGPLPVVLALSRKVDGREQKVVILGDADCLSNGEISRSYDGIRAANFSMVMGAFYWMSDGEVPVNVRRPSPPDTGVAIGGKEMRVWKAVFMWGIPALMLVAWLVIWVRRRSR
jgi:ABC-2 type transport system permease protein